MATGSVLHDFQGNVASTAAARDSTPTGEGVVVLTRDAALVKTLRALGPEYRTATVTTESELASHLLAQNTVVAILDTGAVASPVDRMSERLRAQFPELVLIVAGSVDDQSALAAQITNGTVYRFLHKPVSDQRVRLFVDAAWRRHGEENGGAVSMAAAAASSRNRPSGTNMLLGGAAAAIVAAIGGWLLLHKTTQQQAPPTPVAAAEPVSAEAPRDDVLENLLTRAQAALASGALVAPPGANAADLYREAQRRNPKDARGASGLEKVIDRLLSTAEGQLLAQHLEEAQRLTDLARAIKPDHVRVAFLMAQIGKERERSVLAQARQAASSGNIQQALNVLDGAARDGQKSSLVKEARQELEQKEIGARVQDYVGRARDRMRSGDLLEPAQDNAQFYIESARALAPNDAEVKQTQRQFLDRLVSEARKSLVAGNADQGEHWIQAAADAGVGEDDVAALKQEAQRARATAKTDALARLALLVNQRLTQGKVLEPADDSAKFYLAQLVQADPTFPSTEAARQAFAARTLDEAKGAVGRQDYNGAQHWLEEAHDAGIDQARINAVNDDIRSAQDAAKHVDDVVSAAQLELTRYVPPEFPQAARERALSGWVDVQFIVNTDGSVSDLAVVGAEPAGLFEQTATEAVRKWRYRPVLRDGQPINQRARVRVRFALQK
jgi:TonB family protein